MQLIAINGQLTVVTYYVLVALDQVQADSSLEILTGKVDFEIVVVLSRPDVEAGIILFKRHAEPDF